MANSTSATRSVRLGPDQKTTAKTSAETLSMTSQPARAGTVTPHPSRRWRPYGAVMKRSATKVTTASAISRNTSTRYQVGTSGV
jgi:hypothetical protein